MSSDVRADRVINMMTVDVEDYFHVSAFDGLVSRASWDGFESRVSKNTDELLAIFDRAGVRGTFFVLGWVAARFPGLVRRIADLGHEVASHGFHHQLLYWLTPAQFREDIRTARRAIEDAAGQAVMGYRAPSYSVIQPSLWAIDILIEEGYAYDASIFPIHHDRYGMPGSPRHPYELKRDSGSLLELPGSTVRLGGVNLPIAGGGYFRQFPYIWTKWGIDRVNRVERQPVVFYLHPWEIDPDQPRLPVGTARRVRHYRGLDQTRVRLGRLLTDFRFDAVSTVLNVARLQVA
ncbi:MAG TPA: XrtA system polysaccharide deacetylase [Vicinamibacterales bacterium]|nr:XrtA system polysaccharide deacetylase [Vicinamibacterales bacterium]